MLDHELRRLAAAVPLTADHAADLGEYAGRVFDHHSAHPHLVRLMQWEGLQLGQVDLPGEEQRAAYYAEKVEAVAAAKRSGVLSGEQHPAYLLYAVIALAAWWFSAPQIIRMLTSGMRGDDRLARRTALVEMVRKLTA